MGRSRSNGHAPRAVTRVRVRRAAFPGAHHRPLLWLACLTAVTAAFALRAEAQPPRGPTASPPPGASQAERQFPAQQAIEAYLSEDALQVLYARPLDMGEFGRNEARAGFFLNETRDLIGMADVLVDIGEQRRRPDWAVQLGPRAYGALMAEEDQEVFAIAFGGRLSYFLGRNRQASVYLDAFYAPDIVTFGNANSVTDASIRFETALSEDTRVFVGYRLFEFDSDGDRRVDDKMHIGVRHRF